ncbi:MAG TPA: hypothetical protein VJB05_01020 [archaeon]|nr:hypothetical protein [archaeon]
MMKINLCGKDLKSPLILGSGTLGERKEILVKSLGYGAGAVVTRTLRLDNTKREMFNPGYYIENEYMLNADNNNITPWNYWVSAAGEVEKTGPIIISISARHPEDCKTMVPAIENTSSPSFYELNFSCSHSARIYGRIGYENVEKALENIRQNTKKPVFLKLSLDNTDFDKLREIEHLFDAYVLSNTIGPGLKINIKSRKSVLGSFFGGLSGAAIKPLVMARIWELKQQTKKPVIGVGGIETAEDALEYLILGCDAVQIYTAAHRRGVSVFREINSKMMTLLKDMNETVSSIRGTLKE